MKNELINLADHLDRKGMHKEADYIDTLVKKAVGGPVSEQAKKPTSWVEELTDLGYSVVKRGDGTYLARGELGTDDLIELKVVEWPGS
mgnify:CR=1 FL=1